MSDVNTKIQQLAAELIQYAQSQDVPLAIGIGMSKLPGKEVSPDVKFYGNTPDLILLTGQIATAGSSIVANDNVRTFASIINGIISNMSAMALHAIGNAEFDNMPVKGGVN